MKPKPVRLTQREAERLLQDIKEYKKSLKQLVKLFGVANTRKMLGIKPHEKW